MYFVRNDKDKGDQSINQSINMDLVVDCPAIRYKWRKMESASTCQRGYCSESGFNMCSLALYGGSVKSTKTLIQTYMYLHSMIRSK